MHACLRCQSMTLSHVHVSLHRVYAARQADRLTGRAKSRVRQTQIYMHTNRDLQIVWQLFLSNSWFSFCVQSSCPEFLLWLWREREELTYYEMNTARRPQNTCTRRPCGSVGPCSIKESATDYYLVCAARKPAKFQQFFASRLFVQTCRIPAVLSATGADGTKRLHRRTHTACIAHTVHTGHGAEWDTTELHLRTHRSST
jgi:hypothetical protein